MPHIIVEYSENLSRLNIPLILAGLHEALADQDTIDKASIKTRAIAIQDCVIGGADDYDEMMHIMLKLLPGRDTQLKRTMAQSLYGIACGAVRSEYDQCAVTVEVIELDQDTYTK